jgi:hypothetical protein
VSLSPNTSMNQYFMGTGYSAYVRGIFDQAFPFGQPVNRYRVRTIAPTSASPTHTTSH